MKVRQAYEGRVIEARSSELKDGGWDCEFSIEDRGQRLLYYLTLFLHPSIAFATTPASLHSAPILL
jgi:hypothetical protein